MNSEQLGFGLWDLVEVRGSYPENEWRVCDINLVDRTVNLVSKFDREVNLPLGSIVGKLNLEGK